MKPDHPPVESRNEPFVERPVTRIWQEQPDPGNPYLATGHRCHGYDVMQLAARRSFPEVLHLLFRGELPTPEQAQLLQTLLIACINPGPRHPAGRAAMYLGVSKTEAPHLLPVALTILGGAHDGAGEVEPAIRFLRKHSRRDPAETVAAIGGAAPPPPHEDWHPVPGFGRQAGGVDPYAATLAAHLAALPGAGAALAWGQRLAAALAPLDMGWRPPGVVAAVLADLGFPPRAGAGMYQLISAPGLLAHGLEMANKPFTAMPFVPDARYVIETD